MADKPKPDVAPEGTGATIADSVVAKIAHAACRDVEGVYAMGSATSRALSGLTSSVRGSESRTQGVSVDMRDEDVDVDLTLVVEYGVNIPKVADACRAGVKERVESITGLRVRTINLVVSDIHFPEAAAGPTGAQG